MSRRVIIATFFIICMLMGTACQFALKVWIAPGSTIDDLVFGFSESHGGGESVTDIQIRVYPCDKVGRPKEYGGYYPADEHAVWIAGVPYGAHSAPTNRFAYGKEEYGMKTILGPEPLSAPGCYVVRGSAHDELRHPRIFMLRFKVAADGRVKKK